MYVMLELKAPEDARIIANYGVRAYPNFAVLDAEGQAKIPPGRTLGEIVMRKPPLEAAAILMSFHYRSCYEAGAVPPSADVVMAHVNLLRAYGEPDRAEAWLEGALGNPTVERSELNCLRVYRALALRREGQAEEGLALLREVAPALTLAEASEEQAAGLEHGIAPFTVARGETLFGVVSSDADARLTCDALTWLSGMEGDVPAPDGLAADELAVGLATLAVVLNRPGDAAPWLAAYKASRGEGDVVRASALLAEGIVLAAEGKLAEAAERLFVIVQYASHEPFGPLAGVLASEAARAAGDEQTARRNVTVTLETWGALFPEHLKPRLGAG